MDAKGTITTAMACLMTELPQKWTALLAAPPVGTPSHQRSVLLAALARLSQGIQIPPFKCPMSIAKGSRVLVLWCILGWVQGVFRPPVLACSLQSKLICYGTLGTLDPFHLLAGASSSFDQPQIVPLVWLLSLIVRH